MCPDVAESGHLDRQNIRHLGRHFGHQTGLGSADRVLVVGRTDLEGLGPTELLPIEPFSTWNRLSAASGLTLLLLEQIEGETSFPSQTDAQQQTQQKSVLEELHLELEPCSSWGLAEELIRLGSDHQTYFGKPSPLCPQTDLCQMQ